MATDATSAARLRLTSLPVNYALETLHPRKKKSYERVPPSMRSNGYLTHPDLTKGQKRYLWSICSIYSTAQMKSLIQDQFIRQLFYEMSKGIVKTADWNKYLEYLADPKKRKQQFQSMSARSWKASPDQYKFRYYRDHPVDLPRPMLPSYVEYEIQELTRSPKPPPPKPVRYVSKKRRESATKPVPPTVGPRALDTARRNRPRPVTSPSSTSTGSSSSPSYSLTFTSSGSNGSSNGTSDSSQEPAKTAGEGFTRPKSRIGRRLPMMQPL